MKDNPLASRGQKTLPFIQKAVVRQFFRILDTMREHLGGHFVLPSMDLEKGKHLIRTPGGLQSMNIISESGLYKYIMRSEKDQAEPFQNWVTGEVLPTIRRTGRYEHQPLPAQVTPSLLMPELQAITFSLAQSIQALVGLGQHHAQEMSSVRQDVEALKVQQSIGTGYLSILGYARKHRLSIAVFHARILGNRAAKVCQTRDIPVGKVDEVEMRRQIDALEADIRRQTSGALTNKATDRIMKQALARSQQLIDIFQGETPTENKQQWLRNQLDDILRGMDL